jgi:hypothetical protein
MSTKDGGTAFPSHEHYIADRENGGERKVFTGQPHGGMSLRDYFAAQYICGRAARSEIDIYLNAAEAAYELADAMLKARVAK